MQSLKNRAVIVIVAQVIVKKSRKNQLFCKAIKRQKKERNIKISILTPTTSITPTPTLNKISNSAFRKKTAKNSSLKKFRMSIEKIVNLLSLKTNRTYNLLNLRKKNSNLQHGRERKIYSMKEISKKKIIKEVYSSKVQQSLSNNRFKVVNKRKQKVFHNQTKKERNKC